MNIHNAYFHFFPLFLLIYSLFNGTSVNNAGYNWQLMKELFSLAIQYSFYPVSHLLKLDRISPFCTDNRGDIVLHIFKIYYFACLWLYNRKFSRMEPCIKLHAIFFFSVNYLLVSFLKTYSKIIVTFVLAIFLVL